MKSIALFVTSVLCIGFGGAAWADTMSYDEALQILGLERGASHGDIESRWRKLAMQLHPDRGGSSEQLARVNVAHDRLTKGAQASDRRSTASRPQSKPKPQPRAEPQRPPPPQGPFAFAPRWTTSSLGTGFSTDAKIGDFTLRDVLLRSGTYALFMGALTEYLIKDSRSARGDGFAIYGENPLARRLRLFADMPRALRAIFVACMASPFVGTFSHPESLTVLALGLAEWSRAYSDSDPREQGEELAGLLLRSAQDMESDAITFDPVEEVLIGILTYDVIEALFDRVAAPSLGEGLRMRRLLKLLRAAPAAHAGLLWRTFGLEGKLSPHREALRREIARHPILWREVLGMFEAAKLAPVDLGRLRARASLPVEDRFTSATPIATIKDWMWTSCEFLLAQPVRIKKP